jgi:sulfite dehydrogenase
MSTAGARAALLAAALAAVALPLPAAGDEAADLAEGKRLFTQKAVPACSLCHTLADAGAEGAVGPVLDELKPDAERVAKAVKNGLGQMPAYTTLSEGQVRAIARYVAKASGRAQ